MTVADLRVGGKDPAGEEIYTIFMFNPPHYAIYGISKRVAVRFSDDPSEEATQRNNIAPLNPLRGEINALIDGWRSSSLAGQQRKSRHYDRRVADAINVALEGNLDGSRALLTAIRQEIIDERTGIARVQYLISAFVLIVLLVPIFEVAARYLPHGEDIARAAEFGAVGAFFSIALGIRGRTVLTDLHLIANTTDTVLRVVIGIIAAAVLAAFILADIVRVKLGNAVFSGDGAQPWLAALIFGFIAGFFERLVPDLLARAGLEIVNQPDPALKLQPANPPAGATAGIVAAAAPDEAGAPDASPEETHLDHCLCDLDLSDAPATPDDQLPAAAGGVADGGGRG